MTGKNLSSDTQVAQPWYLYITDTENTDANAR